ENGSSGPPNPAIHQRSPINSITKSIQPLKRKNALRPYEFFQLRSSEVAGLPVGRWREMQIGNGGKRSDFSGIAIVKLETFEGVRVQFEMDVLGEITDHILFRE